MLRHFPLLTLLLCALVLGFSSCGDDDEAPNVPYIGTIADNIADDPQFSTLAAALERTGLDDYLDVPTRRLTLFAPTNAAFEASGVDLASLSDAELKNILNYHIVTGTIINSGDFSDGDSEENSTNKTAPGNNAIPLLVNNNGGTITLNDEATVTASEKGLVNGTIHTIDQLLIPPTIVDRATLDGRFTTLLQALEKVDLDDVLADTGSYTVFAPTDAAFTALGIDPLSLSDTELRNLLLYHVLPKGVDAAGIPGGMSYHSTLNMTGPDTTALSLMLTNAGDSVLVNAKSEIVVKNIFAANGVIHAIDMVLAPQTLVDFVMTSNMLDSLEQAVMATGLVPTLQMAGPYTLFAPTNGAFEAASDTLAAISKDMDKLKSVLLYHVLSGNFTSDELENDQKLDGLNGQKITVIVEKDKDDKELAPMLMTPDSTRINFVTTDIQATNGVLHLIDQVLLPKLD